jgi:hypothetical protein
VHVGAGNGVGRRGGVEVEGDDGRLEQLRVLDEAEDAEAEELAIDGLGLEPLLFEDLDGARSILLDAGAPDGDAERGVDGVGLGVLSPGIKALECLLGDPAPC